MLDSERTFKIKVRSLEQLSKCYLRQQLFAFKEFCMETRLSNIFKTTKVTNLAKVFQESPYRILQVTFKYKTLKQSVYFLKAVEFCPTFNIQIDIFWLYFGKSCKTTLFRKSTELSENTLTSYQ